MSVADMIEIIIDYNRQMAVLEPGTWILYIFLLIVASSSIGFALFINGETSKSRGFKILFMLMLVIFAVFATFSTCNLVWTLGNWAQVKRLEYQSVLRAGCDNFAQSIGSGQINNVSFDDSREIFRFCGELDILKAAKLDTSAIEFKPITKVYSSSRGTTKSSGWVGTPK